MPAFDLKTTIRGSMPRIPFERIARDILGKDYELSLVVCGDTLATKMNSAYRHKTYSPNVLSFPLSKAEGEIFLNIRKAEREARTFDTTTTKRLTLLFVHGCFHLKGLDHGTRMEALEKRILSKYGY